MTVTDKRYFAKKLSDSRNDDGFWRKADANSCHLCRAGFADGQTRYPIFAGVNFGSGWEIVSVCMDCFKECDAGSRSPFERFKRNCRGCDAPMLTPIYKRFCWQVCSARCYQRAHRKRKRALKRCTICRGLFETARRDALYCSNPCRQRAYRLRSGG